MALMPSKPDGAPGGFLLPPLGVRSNLTHGNENNLRLRLLLPGSGQQPGMGSLL
jgi:hypothetical protein